MKLGPGVDTKLGVVSTEDGLFFQPQPDGSMRVMSTNGEAPLATGANLRADHTLSADRWAFIKAIEFGTSDAHEDAPGETDEA